MEESSNGKLEEIQKVESQDGDKEVVIEDSGGLKTDAESVREIVVNGNSDSQNENQNEDDFSSPHQSKSDDEGRKLNKNSAQKLDSGELDEKKIVTDSFVYSIEPKVTATAEELNECRKVPAEQLEALDDVAELESKKIEAHIAQCLEETNEDFKWIEEVILPSSDQNDGSSVIVAEVVSKGIEEVPLSSTEEKGTEQLTLPSSNENVEIPTTTTADVVPKAIKGVSLPALQQNPEVSSGTADSESKEKIDESLQETTSAGAVDTNNNHECNPESTGNPHIISLTQRTIRPTSWRSCCGLLDVLRRSDR